MITAITIPHRAPDGAADVVAMLEAALVAVDPVRVVRANLALDGDELVIGGRRVARPSRVRIIAFGKAAASMAAGAAEALDPLPLDGLVVTAHAANPPPGLDLIVAGHPLPDDESRHAARRALELAASAPDDALVLFLVSGGGSSLLALPAPGVDFGELRTLVDHLLHCGATIDEINTVRRHLSAVKAGRLAAATDAPFATLALSDVVGSDPQAIASGPTVAARTTSGDVRAVIEAHAGHCPIPPSIAAHLEDAEPVVLPEAPYVIVGDGASAARAAAEEGIARGLPARVESTSLIGEAREAAAFTLDAVRPGAVGVFAGETTVTVSGTGRGGRNQEAALAAAIALDGAAGSFTAFGTDGIDGPTPAAGAMVDGRTARAARAAGISLPDVLADNDAHPALAALGCTLVTGPTGTNVGDLWIVDKR